MCRIFIHNQEPKFLIVVHFKVMYSTFKTVLLKNFPNVKELESKGNLCLDDYTKISVVRLPHERIVSLYFDKCKQDPFHQLKKNKMIRLQPCQKQILSLFSWKYNDTIDNIIELKDENKDSNNGKIIRECMLQLQQISFPDFCNICEKTFLIGNQDQHFTPQSQNFKNLGIIDFELLIDMRLIHENWKIICKVLKKDIELENINQTRHNQYLQYYINDSYKQIENLYKDDMCLIESLN